MRFNENPLRMTINKCRKSSTMTISINIEIHMITTYLSNLLMESQEDANNVVDSMKNL